MQELTEVLRESMKLNETGEEKRDGVPYEATQGGPEQGGGEDTDYPGPMGGGPGEASYGAS